jgi:hypothetical protein
VTPPEITRLEMDAAIAQQQHAAAQARASIATLEHQRSLLGLPLQPSSSSPQGGSSWLLILLIAAAAFVIGAKAAHDEPQRYEWAPSSSHQ